MLLAGLVLHARTAAAVFTEITFVTVQIDGRSYDLEVMFARPAAAGRYPVALITHGTTNTGLRARDMRAETVLGGWARDFAARGYLAVAVMRRGYGLSDGRVFNDAGKCDMPAPRRYIDKNADDLDAVITALASRKDADVGRIIGVGQSMGGLTLLALAARSPARLSAVFNISGGLYRYENRDGLIAYNAYEGCDKFKAAIVDALREYGARSRTPTYWYYAENDPWFVPATVEAMKSAWTSKGGKANLVMLPPSSINGHDIFYEARSRQLLLPEIDGALRQAMLSTWEPRDFGVLAGSLSATQRTDLDRYLRLEGAAKALAISPADPVHLYWSAGQPTLGRAVDAALADCAGRGNRDCRVIMRNFELLDRASMMTAM